MQPRAELRHADHLAGEVMVVEPDPTARPQHPLQLGEEARLIEPVHTRTARGRVERRVGEGHLLRVPEQVVRTGRAPGRTEHLRRNVDTHHGRRVRGERHGRHPGAARDVERALDLRVAHHGEDARERSRMVERPAVVVDTADARRRERVVDPIRKRKRHGATPSTCGSACASCRRGPRPRPHRRDSA